jgi:hypothetical protein
VRNGTFCDAIYLSNASSFYQDRLGTNIGESTQNKMVFRIELITKQAEMVYAVRKTPLFEPFKYINEHFTETGSGQT